MFELYCGIDHRSGDLWVNVSGHVKIECNICHTSIFNIMVYTVPIHYLGDLNQI